MQMKEICEKTGLTDRAVRLYIENGLLSPAIESNYAGRRSIRFTERDTEILLAIAALRREDDSQKSILKEDSGMHLKDLQSLIRRRIPSVIGFAAFLIGTILFTPLAGGKLIHTGQD